MKIVLIDDDEIEKIKFQKTFEQLGLEVDFIYYPSPSDALNYLINQIQHEPLPDIIFLDINMPQISGFEILDRIRDQEWIREVNTIILTTSGNLEDIEKGYEYPIKEYWQKPRYFEEFKSKLAKYIERINRKY